MKINNFDLVLLDVAIKDLEANNGGDNWWCEMQRGYGDGKNAGMGKPITALRQFLENLREASLNCNGVHGICPEIKIPSKK